MNIAPLLLRADSNGRQCCILGCVWRSATGKRRRTAGDGRRAWLENDGLDVSLARVPVGSIVVEPALLVSDNDVL